MKPRLILVVMFATVLASCRVGPNYRKPIVPVPNTFRAADQTTSTNNASIADSKWFEVFKDEQLQKLIHTALSKTTICARPSYEWTKLEPVSGSPGQINDPPSESGPASPLHEHPRAVRFLWAQALAEQDVRRNCSRFPVFRSRRLGPAAAYHGGFPGRVTRF